MRKFISTVINSSSPYISTRSLTRITKQRLVLPFYHLVSDDEIIHIKYLQYHRSIKQFENDLDFFLKHFKPLELKDLINVVNNNLTFPENSFHLSFDDGLSEVYHYAAPILKRKGIPATIFLNSKFIDNNDLFYRYKASILIDNYKNKHISNGINDKLISCFSKFQIEFDNFKNSTLNVKYKNNSILNELADILDVSFDEYLLKHKPYLSSEQITKLIKDGFSIGSHSIDHPEYRFLPFDSQIAQTEESIEAICDKFSLNYRAFSFPFTDHGITKKFFEYIFDNKSAKIDISFGCAGLKKDSPPSHFQRIPMEEMKFSGQTIINSEYLYYILKAPFLKNKIRRN